MRALVYDGKLRLRNDCPPPVRKPGESLVDVSLAGICATDLEIVKGYMGFHGVLGHEFVGRVRESDRADLIGERVVGEINCPCGRCALCRRGLGKHCPVRSVLGIQGRDGAFADSLVLPDANLHLVPEGVADRAAVFTEPLAAAWQALIQGSPSKGEDVVVLGDGRLGILVAMVFASEGIGVTLLGKHEEKLALARKAGAKTGTIGGGKALPRADLVVEATGSPSGLETALKIVRPAGRIVLKTTIAGSHTIGLAPLVVDEITVIGSRCGPFDRALRSLASRSVDVSALVGAEFPLEKGVEAMRAAAAGSLKVLLAISRAPGMKRTLGEGCGKCAHC